MTQVWDVRSGVQLATIDPHQVKPREIEHIGVSADWSRLYMARNKMQSQGFERDRKRMIRSTYEGELIGWDLRTGQVVDRWQHSPPHSIYSSQLLPDGKSVLLREMISGEYETNPNRGTRWLDLERKTSLTLPNGFDWFTFSRDGKWLFAQRNEDRYAKELVVFDAKTLRQLVRIEATAPRAHFSPVAVTPDEKTVIGIVSCIPDKGNYSAYRVEIKAWEATGGKEIFNYAAPGGVQLLGCQLSPDFTRVFTCEWNSGEDRVHVIDLAHRKLLKIITPEARQGPHEKVVLSVPAFSPDGKWLVVPAQHVSADVNPLELTDDDRSQVRLHFIDTATLEVKESLVAGQGVHAPTFSPDGKTLACIAKDRVRLFDFRRPPGAGVARQEASPEGRGKSPDASSGPDPR